MLRSWMRRLPAAAGAVLIAGLSACETAPVTERQQLILIPEGQAAEMGASAFQQILSQSQLSSNSSYNRRVETIGRRIVDASPESPSDWEFVVIEDATPNAFALPGGKVAVHTGMFDVAQNDAQLAAVIAHEIGHVLARHSSERMSRQLLVEGGLAVGSAALGAGGAGSSQLLAQAATLGLILPFSRDQEAEADRIGLELMAKAGYDPRDAVTLWQNFQEAGGERAPEFLSTHPAPQSRIERLQQAMPEVLGIYRSRSSR